MEMQVETTSNDPVVTVLKLIGELDSATARTLVAEGKRLYDEGATNLLLDMSELSFMGSSGLVALHNLAGTMRGESMGQDVSAMLMFEVKHTLMNANAKEAHFKLLSPQKRIAKTLTMTGFNQLLDIFTDRDEAIASFAD